MSEHLPALRPSAEEIRSRNLERKFYKGWSVSAEFGKATGCQKTTAHRKLHGDNNIRDLVVHAIRAFRRAHAHERLAQWIAPIERELEFEEPPPFTAETALEYVTAAAHDAVARFQFITNPSPQTWRRLSRAIRSTQWLATRFLAAGDARFGKEAVRCSD